MRSMLPPSLASGSQFFQCRRVCQYSSHETLVSTFCRQWIHVLRQLGVLGSISLFLHENGDSDPGVVEKSAQLMRLRFSSTVQGVFGLNESRCFYGLVFSVLEADTLMSPASRSGEVCGSRFRFYHALQCR